MAQHMEPTRGPERRALLKNAGESPLLQLRQEGCRSLRRQTGDPKGQGIGREHAAGVLERRGLLINPAMDQGAVVVQRGAQAQLQLQGLPLPPGGRQGPAAGAVEEIPLMNQGTAGPKLSGIRPPTKGQTSTPIPPLRRLPGLRAHELQAQAQPSAAAGPAQQSALMPVRTVARTPGVINGQNTVARGTLHAPEGQHIPTGLGLKRFNPGAKRALWPLRHRSTRSRPIG